MTKQEQIEEMAVIGCVRNPQAHTAEECAKCDFKQGKCNAYRHAEKLYDAGYRKFDKDSVVLTRVDYEMLKSLYDTQKGAIMTSSIGDLPLTIGGLRKAVDEITRLNRVETELQELNAKYYNEAKDLRRELKQARKETAKEIFQKVVNICRKEEDFQDGTVNTQLEPLYFGIMNGCAFIRGEIKDLAKQYGVEVEE